MAIAREDLVAMGRDGDPAAADVLAAIAGEEALVDPQRSPAGASTDVADRIAHLVASSAFPATLFVLIVGWLVVNVVARPFEPFPIIVLAVISAVLASLAALQAPIILRVQRRQGERDRERDEADHRTTLKAELELRYLDHKVTHLLELLQPRIEEDAEPAAHT